MTRTGFFVRLGLSLVLDLLDFTVGRALFAVPWEEGAGAAIATMMWGPAGILYLLELIDVTEQVDAFIPVATLIGLWVGWRRGFLFARPGAATTPAPPEKGPPR
ncbi:MAG: hypothetical protein KJS97_06015 [Alphaproteobacteria bacterium]|nr:hypothetical protein [Alphaproteobacteria bacterium]